ncbi:MAG: hypothetical protein ACOX09_04480 [Candidatus Kapaibacterium sp.]|jgi:hypothetical protein
MKKITLLIALFILAMPLLSGAGKYVKVLDQLQYSSICTATQVFTPVSENYLYAVNSDDGFYLIDKEYNTKFYTAGWLVWQHECEEVFPLDFKDNFEELYKVPSFFNRVIRGFQMFDDTTAWVATQRGGFYVFRVITKPGEEFECIKRYNASNVKGFGYSGYKYSDTGSVQIVNNFVFDKKKEFVYFIGSGVVLNKMRTDNPDTIEWQTKKLTDIDGYQVAPGLGCPIIFALMENEKYIWYQHNIERILLTRIDTKTGEVKVFGPDVIPHRTSTNYKGDTGTVSTSLIMPKHNTIFVATHSLFANKNVSSPDDYYNDGVHYADSILNTIAIYQNEKWDTLAFPYHLLDSIDPNGNTIRCNHITSLKQWTEDEVLFCINNYRILKNAYEIYLIYNLATKQWRKEVAPPDEIKNNPGLTSITFMWNGKRYVTKNFKCVYVYENDDSVEEPTEAGLLPDIWIRSISPNPASMRVTANIMYYPPGGVFGSEEFDVGLYNILGQKLIDLTHLGRYSDYNKTFEVTFDIPNSINNGAYFISVKNANEIRSKMLSIVRERE